MKVYDVIYSNDPYSNYPIVSFRKKEDADRLAAEFMAMRKELEEPLVEDGDTLSNSSQHETGGSDGEFYVREVEIEESYESYMGRERDEER